MITYMTLESKVIVHTLKIFLMAPNERSSLIFFDGGHSYWYTGCFSVNMTAKVSGCKYDLQFKCQVQIYLKPAYGFLKF